MTDEEGENSEPHLEAWTQQQPPEMLSVEKALLDAITKHAQDHNGLHNGDVITVDGYPGVTVTVSPGADGEPFGLTVEGITIGDPKGRQ